MNNLNEKKMNKINETRFFFFFLKKIVISPKKLRLNPLPPRDAVRKQKKKRIFSVQFCHN